MPPTRSRRRSSAKTVPPPELSRWRRLLFNHLPLLGQPLRAIAIERLARRARQQEPGAALLLAEALSLPLAPKTKQSITTLLEQVTDERVSDGMWQQALTSRSETLFAILTKLGRPASETSPARAASLIELEMLAQLRQASPLEVDQLIGLFSNPHFAQPARSALGQLRGQAGIDRLCEVWAGARQPDLESILLETGYTPRRPAAARVLTLLKQQRPEAILTGDAGQVPALVAACQDSDPQVRALAVQCLPNLQDPKAIDEVCRLWLESRTPLLEGVLQKARYQAQLPLQVRIYTALLTGRVEIAAASPPEGVDTLFKACQDGHPAIASAARQALLSLQSPAARAAVCQRVILFGDVLSQEIALQAAYLPETPRQRALFLFLTGQFAAYDALDFDHRLLQAAYETVAEPVKKRITRQIQNSGKMEYLNILTGPDYTFGRAGLALEEIQAFIQTLSEAQAWERLWQALPRFPLVWAVEGFRRLAAAGWAPLDAADQASFQEILHCLCEDCPLAPAELEAQLPFAVRRAVLKIRGRVNDLSFSPDGAQLAIGTGARRVGFWDYQHARLNRVVSGFNHSISRVLYLPEGSLYCGQRSVNHTTCSIYGWEGDRSFFLGSHLGAVVALEGAGAGRMLSAGRDGKLILWDLAAHKPLVERTFSTWPRTVAVSPDGTRAAVQTEHLHLVSLPDLADIPFRVHSRVRSPVSKGIFRCACFDPLQGSLVAGQYNGQVLLYALNPNQRSFHRDLLFNHADPVVAVQFMPGHPFLVSGSQKGSLHITRWPDQLPAADLQIPEGRLTSLRISADGSFLATGTSDEQIILWDLRALDIPGMLSKPIVQASLHQLSMLNTFLEEETIPAPARRTIRLLHLFLMRHFSHDIEIGDVPGIQPGEFDIIIE